MTSFPEHVEVHVEVPRGSFMKRGADGVLDFASPAPTPFNYGSIPAIAGADGDALDAVLLGPRRAVGHRENARVLGFVRFIDAGDIDDKVICGASPLRRRDWLLVNAFFVGYSAFKIALNLWRGKPGRTRYRGWERASEGCRAGTIGDDA